MTDIEKINFIRNKLDELDLMIQLAEECSEASAAILKLCRKSRAANPTPMSADEIRRCIQEEVTDVKLCFDVLGIIDTSQYNAKLSRWVERIQEDEWQKVCTTCADHDIFSWMCSGEGSEKKGTRTAAGDTCEAWRLKE